MEILSLNNYENKLYNNLDYDGYIMLTVPVLSFNKNIDNSITIDNEIMILNLQSKDNYDLLAMINNSYMDYESGNAQSMIYERLTLPVGQYTIVKSFCVKVTPNSSIFIGFDKNKEYFHLLNSKYSNHIKVKKIPNYTNEIREYLIGSWDDFKEIEIGSDLLYNRRWYVKDIWNTTENIGVKKTYVVDPKELQFFGDTHVIQYSNATYRSLWLLIPGNTFVSEVPKTVKKIIIRYSISSNALDDNNASGQFRVYQLNGGVQQNVTQLKLIQNFWVTEYRKIKTYDKIYELTDIIGTLDVTLPTYIEYWQISGDDSNLYALSMDIEFVDS